MPAREARAENQGISVSVRKEIQNSRARIEALEKEIKVLRDSMPVEEVIVLRTVSKDEAKREVLELFQAGGTFFYSDIAERLRLDLPMVVEICQELEEEGEIGEIER
jgi:hypothetical protein